MNQKTDAFRIDEDAKPYSNLNFKNDPDEFQFAMITDNAGGARPGVFSRAVEMVNLLQPEFVVNAGDLIEGYGDDEEQIRAWWQEIDEEREYVVTAAAEKLLAAGEEGGWTMVSMKDDWKTIFKD